MIKMLFALLAEFGLKRSIERDTTMKNEYAELSQKRVTVESRCVDSGCMPMRVQ